VSTVVVGGGLSGLVCAASLLRKGEDVTVLDEADRPGGVVRTERRDGYLLEMGPNTVRPTAELWDLVVELGLETEALLSDPRAPRFVDFGGRRQPIPMSPAGLATTRLLSVGGKLRLLAEPLVPRSRSGEESVEAFFTRRLGPQVAQRFVEPFVSGIFAGDASRLSVDGCFPMLARWEREHGGLLRGALAAMRGPRKRKAPVKGLLSFREGLETLPRALAGRLGDRLRRAAGVEAIRRGADGWTVRTASGDLAASRVVLATSAPRAAALLAEASPSAARALSGIPHPPLAVLHLSWPDEAFPEPLGGFGHLVVPQSGRRILGAVYSSSLFAGRAPQGRALLTVFVGGSRDPESAGLSDAALVEAATRDLAAVLGVQGAPQAIGVMRYKQALPQYELGHLDRMRALDEAERACPGLTLLGNYRGGVSVGDVVQNASRIQA
jgi:oxygen-dependent protoporphyrinogen oxidase